ncbi:uncharacterized protein LOC119986573 isoform X1 [Tripterygium wilfordii]|uniref:uncharacterized protein LOC119986573 isoform X1 n=1 Tax=Tripterygium wilfordii TaxID=458696 RepID=UPI0018F846C5|nr:uncharacterized protein LOC119986573 isoform X1 [Tripterygium wilfordii]
MRWDCCEMGVQIGATEISNERRLLGARRLRILQVSGPSAQDSYTSLWYIPGRLPHINFCSASPRRVKSLMLSNIFLETQSFATAMPWAPVVSRTPSCLQKRYVLTGIRDGPPHEPFMADSVDFVVSQI